MNLDYVKMMNAKNLAEYSPRPANGRGFAVVSAVMLSGLKIKDKKMGIDYVIDK